MVLKQLVVFADSDVSLRLETVADQTAISSNTVSPAPLRIRRSTIYTLFLPVYAPIYLLFYVVIRSLIASMLLIRVIRSNCKKAYVIVRNTMIMIYG